MKQGKCLSVDYDGISCGIIGTAGVGLQQGIKFFTRKELQAVPIVETHIPILRDYINEFNEGAVKFSLK